MFTDKRYSRRHVVTFDGGAQWAASSSPHSVPLPFSDAAAVDPEEMLVAALASCHMLWFLGLAAEQGFCVDRYTDHAVGELGRDAKGHMAMTVVTLRPRVVFSPAHQPSPHLFAALHLRAHEQCYVANSIKADVRCEPQMTLD
jgi:organic hydroperoxide reductase OsmC/OhrA